MNQRPKELWIEALRTGVISNGIEPPISITQARKALRPSHNTMCCMGVLCEIHRRETLEDNWIDDETYAYLGERGVLPDEVSRWAGLKRHNPTIITRGEIVPLGSFNDNGHSFAEIANLIEHDAWEIIHEE